MKKTANITRIIYRSETYIQREHIVGAGTWAEMTIPEQKKRRYFITTIFDDGYESTSWTNGDGEGLFAESDTGAEYQITGLSQYCITGSTRYNVKRNLLRRHKNDIANGVTVEFELEDF